METRSTVAESMSVDLDSRTIRHWINKRSVDSYKTLILPRGIDIARFQKSPSVWMNHDYSLKSILGKNLEVEVRDDGVVALTQTAPRPPSLSETVEWAPDTILWLHKTGDLRGWSIGFDPVEAQRPSEDDRREFGDELKEVLSKTRLVEYSAVGIPSNEDSNTLASKGVSDRLLRWWEDTGRPTRVWCEGGKCVPLDQLRSIFPQNSKVTVSMSVPEVVVKETAPGQATIEMPAAAREACSCTATREAAASKGNDTSAHDNAYSVVANYTGGKSTYEQAVFALDMLTLPDGEKAKFKKTLDDFKAGLPALPADEAKDGAADASKDGPEHGPGRSRSVPPTVSKISKAVEEHKLDDYGFVFWNPENGEAKLSVGDWHDPKDWDELLKAISDIDGVSSVSVDAEVGCPKGWWDVRPGGKSDLRSDVPTLVLDDTGGFTAEACLQKAEELGYDVSTLMAEDIASGAMTESKEHGLAFGEAVKIACDHLLEDPMYYERGEGNAENFAEEMAVDEAANEQELEEEEESAPVDTVLSNKNILIIEDQRPKPRRGGTSERPKLIIAERSIESRVSVAVSRAIEKEISKSRQERRPKIILG